MTFTVTISICAFLISLLGTRLTILALRKRTAPLNLTALRKNIKPVPGGGGVAVIFALVICLMIADINYGVMLSLLLLMAIALLHDLIGVAPLVRLMVQVMAITVPLSMTDTLVFGGYFPVWLDKVATTVLWIGCTNFFTFMDHLDGLAVTETISVGTGLAILAVMGGFYPSAISTYGTITAAGAMGFLWWNWPPAKIRLGEVGSTPLGFLLGYFLLLTILSGHIAAALILPAYFFSDSIITAASRLMQRKSIWKHGDHYYLTAVHRGRKPETVLRMIAGVNILLVFLAARTLIEPDLAVFYLATAYLCVFMLLGFFAHSHPAGSHEST